MVNRKWFGIVIHHTRSHDVSIKEIEQWHKDQGWPHVGYHKLIRSDGSREDGCPLSIEGIHARGKNSTHIGVALTGCFSGVPPNHKTLIEPTSNQLITLKNTLEELCDTFIISPLNIVRHHSLCPGDRLPLEEIIRGLNVTLNLVDYRSKIKERLLKASGKLDAAQNEFKAVLELLAKI
jgi:hypothetical protein